ncbi:MAG: hypothetical protein Kow0037_06380 [Calditrichia bacterium]
MVYGSPRYSLFEGSYKGNPVIEILKDKEPFWDHFSGHKSHFRFGLNKAELILYCLEIIEGFVKFNGSHPKYESPVLYETDEGFEFSVKTNSYFERNGKTIYSPYIELSAGLTTIKFGLQKAAAILELQDEIYQFYVKHTEPSPK